MHRFQRWRDLFQGASTVQGVERLIRDYVDSIPPTVLAALPDECRRALGDPNVQRAAVTILHCELAFKGEPATAEQLHEVAHTFAAASLRITRLTKEADDRRLISNYPVNDPGRFLQRFKTKRPYSGRLFSMYMFISPIEGLPSGPSQRP